MAGCGVLVTTPAQENNVAICPGAKKKKKIYNELYCIALKFPGDLAAVHTKNPEYSSSQYGQQELMVFKNSPLLMTYSTAIRVYEYS